MKPLLIGGEWVTTSHAVDNVNPSDTADIIDQYAQAGRAETQAAISAARTAFESWAYSTPQERHDVLKAAGDEILARKQEIGTLLSREEGKVIAEGIAETVRAAQIFHFFAGEALRLTGDLVPSVRPGIGVEITREPVGVVAAIAPWNFPIAIPAWKIAPAICYGNAVVLKPAELVPGCAWEIADVLHRAGLPAGVLNLVIGPGSVVGQTLLDDPQVDAVTFTGSQGVGARVAEASSRLMRRCQLEMGGKNPLVVLDDADLDLAVDVALNGSYFSTGQRCTASSRLIVTEGIHGRFIETLAERLRATRVGHALDADSRT
ncbi:MAG: aldehyde dehydrogenase family protein, partial [Pseudomonadota bacterium]